MRVLVGFCLMAIMVAGCVSGTGLTTGKANTCIAYVPGPDGKMRKSVIESDDPAVIASLCQGTPESVAALAATQPKDAPSQNRKVALPTVAEAPQTMETQDLGGGRSVKTFTYGTPPSTAPAVRSVAKAQTSRPTVIRRVPVARPGCVLGGGVMQGGAGYCIGY